MREVTSTGGGVPRPPSAHPGLQEAEPARSRAGVNRAGLAVLWVLAILLFGVGDLLTSSLAFSMGAYEGNPVANFLIEISGGSIWSLTIFKGFILSSLFLLSLLKMDDYAWTVPAVLSCAGAYMLFHNLAVLLMIF